MKRRSNPFSNLLTDDELVFLTKVLPSFRSDGECGADFQWSVRQVREQPAMLAAGTDLWGHSLKLLMAAVVAGGGVVMALMGFMQSKVRQVGRMVQDC